ncbi:hypothetical protein Tco_0346903, partial [Tanacetum coccineum]
KLPSNRHSTKNDVTSTMMDAYVIYHSPIGTDNQEKDEKQSQNDKTGLGMEKTVKDKANKAGKSIKSKSQQKSQLVKVKVNPSQPRDQSSRNISLGAEIAKP